jgi:RNA polymerase sigma-70 factor (ECF subfamily)
MHNGDIKLQIEAHHAAYYGWALHCCNRDAEMASEVLQASYVKILERQNTFKATSEFRTWAFTVIKNTATDASRKQKKSFQLNRSDAYLPDAGYETVAGGDFDEKLRQLFFTEALNQLAERQRQILQLVFYHDMSLNQAAKVLNISQGSARKHYDRAKKLLALWFNKKGIPALQ